MTSGHTRTIRCRVQPWRLREAARIVYSGGIIAYPTEAVYGLGCNPLDGTAVQRLLTIKGRPPDKGLILIAADFNQLRPYIGQLETSIMQPVLDSWPGPTTWILPAAEDLPGWLSGWRDSLAVRVTAHPVAAALCRSCGTPLVSTSANPSGRRPARTALAVRRYFSSGVDLIVSAPVGELGRPTRIRNALGGGLVRE